MKLKKSNDKETPEVKKLRESVQKKYKKLLSDDTIITEILKDFNANIEIFHNYYKKEIDYNHVKNNFENASKFFTFYLNFPYESNWLEGAVEKLRIEKATILSFIHGNSKTPSFTTRDFFSVCMEYGNFKSFLKNYPDADPLIKKYSEANNNHVPPVSLNDEYHSFLKELNTIPQFEIDKYVLRINILEDIFNLFQQNKKICVAGISGTGKTFLIKHFIQHYYNSFDHVVWLNCSKGLLNAFTHDKGIGLAYNLGLVQELKSFPKDKEQNEKLLYLITNCLRNIQGRNLLILDNADEAIYDYEDEINLTENWNVIAISHEVLDGFYHFYTPNFEEASVKLFYKFYKREEDNEMLLPLLSSIEYHTLTIELLAKTAQQMKLSIMSLVNRFKENGVNIAEKAKVITKHNKERGLLSIENIEEYLNIIFDTSELNDEECKIALNIALLQEDSIPLDLFQEIYLNNSSEQEITDVFIHHLHVLTDKGWVQNENNKIRLHNLVKDIIIKRYVKRSDFYKTTVYYLGEKIYLALSKNIFREVDYLTLAESLLENITQETEDIIYLKTGVAIFLKELGLFEKAKSNLKFSLVENKKEKSEENIYELMMKLQNFSSISMIQDNPKKTLYYSERIYGFFDDNERDEMYSDLIKSLTYFFNEVTICTILDFENKFELDYLIYMVESQLFSLSNIIIFRNIEKDPNEIIKNLQRIVSKKQSILDILEKNIPERVLLSMQMYKFLSWRNSEYLNYIGIYYQKLKEYENAKLFVTRSLNIQEKILDKEQPILSSTYYLLTLLYVESEDLKKAKFYLEKNNYICHKLPKNHPHVLAYQESYDSFRKLKHKRSLIESLEKINSQKPNTMNEKNETLEYYNSQSSIYYEHEDFEKANEYIRKEINIHLKKDNIDYSQLAILYIKSGLCFLNLGNIDKALELYGDISQSIEKKNDDDETTTKLLSDFLDLLMKKGFQSNNIPIISFFICQRLTFLENKYATFALNLEPV